MHKPRTALFVSALFIRATLALWLFTAGRLAAQPRPMQKTSTATSRQDRLPGGDSARGAQVRSAYVARVTTVANELKPRLAEVWGLYEDMKNAYGATTRRARSASLSPEREQLIARAKAALVERVKDVRTNARRIRAISPVPQSLRRADGYLVAFSCEVEQALESLMLWCESPTHEMDLQASRQLREASTTLATALKQIEARTDPAVRAKVYVED